MQRNFNGKSENLVYRLCLQEFNKKKKTAPSFQNADWSRVLKIVPPELFGLVRARIQSITSLSASDSLAMNRREITLWKNRLLLLNCLKEVSKNFRKKRIDFILLKGFALEKRIYAPNVRFFSDLDILIPEKDALRAEQALKALNYTQGKDTYPPCYYAKYKQHLVFSKKGKTNIKVDLHTELAEKYSGFEIRNEELFEKANSELINRMKIKVLSNEHQLLHLCLHFIYVHPYGSDIKSSYEIAMFIKKNQINWNEFTRLCVRTKTAAIVYQAFSFSQGFFNFQAPKASLTALKKAANTTEISLLRFFSPENKVSTRLLGYKTRKWIIKFILAKGIERKNLILQDVFYSWKYQQKRTRLVK